MLFDWAVLILWTGILFLMTDWFNSLFNRRFEMRRQEAERVIRESPYLQHLGLRPPKPSIPWVVWLWSFIIWVTGCIFYLSNAGTTLVG